MQEEDIATLKGADYITIFVDDHSNINGKFKLTALNANDLPVYDVYLVVRSHIDLPMDTPEQQEKAMQFIMNPDKYEIGNIAKHGVKDTGVLLEPGYYQIDIRTRYAKYTEMLKFGSFKGVLGKSISVTNFQGNVLHQSTYPEDFAKIY